MNITYYKLFMFRMYSIVLHPCTPNTLNTEAKGQASAAARGWGTGGCNPRDVEPVRK